MMASSVILALLAVSTPAATGFKFMANFKVAPKYDEATIEVMKEQFCDKSKFVLLLLRLCCYRLFMVMFTR